MAHRPEHLASGSSPPTRTTMITCRDCGALPAERGDQVSAQAAAYTCSRCLCATRSDDPLRNSAPAGITLPEARSPEHAPNSSTERGRRGRRRLHPDNAARQAAYRSRAA
jgi:hypothetical protein